MHNPIIVNNIKLNECIYDPTIMLEEAYKHEDKKKLISLTRWNIYQLEST